MAIAPRAVGTWAAVNATTQTVTLPTHASGDMLIVRAVCKPYSATPVINTSGWAAVGTAYANGTTGSGNGTGSVKAVAFYKEATSSSETNPVITWGTTVTPGAAAAVSYQKDGGGNIWMTPVGDGGGDTSAGTGHSATIQSHVSVTAGDMVDAFTGICDDTTMTVPTFTQTSVTYAAVTEYPATALTSTTSDDISADGCYRLASSGTSSAAAVVTGTTSTSETGTSWMTRLRQVVPKSTSVGEVSLAPYTPATQDSHRLKVRARVTSGAGTAVLKAALYEGSTNRSGDLTTSALTASLADYTLAISDANAATITDYSNLGVRFWGHAPDGAALVFEIDYIALLVPESAGPPPAPPPPRRDFQQMLAH
jgi:hypothetical protein